MLITEKIKKTFEGLKALDGVNVKVEKENITLIIGPNGSGKTTLINTITGYYTPDEGDIYFEGKNITGLSMDRIYHLGIVRSFQIPSLFFGLNVLENLLISYKINPGEFFTKSIFRKKWLDYEEKAVKKAFSVMKKLNIENYWDSSLSSLPVGHLKLIDIGRALMADAKLIILDEPIAGVNAKLANEIFSYILDLKNNERLSFLIIEHRIDIALQYVDYVYVLNYGKIISEGKPEEIINDPLVKKVYLGE